jgi:hypothetical protein
VLLVDVEAGTAEAAVGFELTAAVEIPRSEFTVDTGIPRLAAISEGFCPSWLIWTIWADSESLTLSADGCGALGVGVTGGGMYTGGVDTVPEMKSAIELDPLA